MTDGLQGLCGVSAHISNVRPFSLDWSKFPGQTLPISFPEGQLFSAQGAKVQCPQLCGFLQSEEARPAFHGRVREVRQQQRMEGLHCLSNSFHPSLILASVPSPLVLEKLGTCPTANLGFASRISQVSYLNHLLSSLETLLLLSPLLFKDLCLFKSPFTVV